MLKFWYNVKFENNFKILKIILKIEIMLKFWNNVKILKII